VFARLKLELSQAKKQTNISLQIHADESRCTLYQLKSDLANLSKNNRNREDVKGAE
jgi:hypothetical protein